MRILAYRLDAARQPDAAVVVAIEREHFARHRGDLAIEESAVPGLHGPLEAARGVGVDGLAADLIASREVLGGTAHGDACRRIEQRLPEEILEFDPAHVEAAAMGVGGDRITAHRFRADAQRGVRAAQRHGVGGLADHLEPGPADALHQMGGHLDRHAGIEADMARQHVGVEARLRHRSADDGSDILRRDGGARQRLAAGLDAEIDRRDQRQRALVVDEGRAHPVKKPDVAPFGADCAFRAAHVSSLLTQAPGPRAPADRRTGSRSGLSGSRAPRAG